MTERDILVKAGELCQRSHISNIPFARVTLARDSKGYGVKPTDPRATMWSSIGAVHRVEPVETGLWTDTTEAGKRACALLDQAAEDQGFLSAPQVDEMGPAAVQKMFSRAVSLAEQRRAVRR